MKNGCLLCCLLLTVPVFAQHYAIKQLSVERGLSNNYVVSIAQDKQGFLWFATEEGLNKFDGTRFITYYKNELLNGYGITGNELNCLLDDPQDPLLWIGTQRAGLNAYNYVNDTFTFYHHNDSIPESVITDDITGLVAADDGNLWVATYWKGVDYYDKKTGFFTHYNRETVPELISDNVWAIADGGNGKLYIGHVQHGLSVLSVKNKRVKNFMYDPNDENSLPGNEVRCVYRDKNNNIWVGTNKGLALFNPESENFIHFNSERYLSHYIYDIRQFEEKLWIATEFGGIAIMDLTQRLFLLPEQTRFQFIEEGDDGYSLSNSSVRCLFQDSYLNIWAGIWGGGINFLSHEPLLFSGYFYSPNQSSRKRLNNKIALSVCTDSQGKLWVGTDGGGINVFDRGARVAVFPEEDGNSFENSVQASLCDSEGNLWFGLFHAGVSYYDTQRKRFHQNYLPEIAHEDVRSIYEDNQKTLWFGTSNGIYKVDIATKKITGHYANPTNNLVRCVIKDYRGNLWVGSFGGGLEVNDSEMKNISYFNISNEFPSNAVNAIYEDSKKNIWVGTGEGLVCFSSLPGLKYKVYRREDGLANVHIRAIAEDGNGNIWVSTNKSISCLLKDWHVFYNYDAWANVPMGNFMSGSVAQGPDGEIYFGSINGLCYFDPEFVLAKREPPIAIITEIKTFSPIHDGENSEDIVAINGQSIIKLGYLQNSFNITFNVRNNALADQVEYAYMLKGLEDSWYTVTGPNEVIFHNIPHGDYRFLVKTRIRNQEWSDEMASLDIKIVPPLWLTWWAKLLYLLTGVIIVLVIINAYKRKLDIEVLYDVEKKSHEREQELNNERLRFYTNITHELRTPLTLILGPLEDMCKSNVLQAKDAQRISVIHQNAIRLMNLINQILEFRKTETQNKKLCVSYGNITPLIYEIGLKYKELNRKPDIEFHIEVEKEYMPLYFDKEMITIILDNLISNAVKYTRKGSMTLALYTKVQNNISYTEIKVSDTGFGINPDALSHIFDRYYQERSNHQVSGTGIGLALVKNLVVLHEGDIRVESTLDEGSTFYVSLLTDNTYPHALHADSPEINGEEKEENEEVAENIAHDENRILLVVEDNQDICNYIVESFSDEFDVRTAVNGEEGVLQALNCIPDIIISDIMMPVMSGIELCKSLKEDVQTSHIPIILLTAKDSLQDKEEGYGVGADSYLTKPFSANLLHSRINNLLESRQRLAEHYNKSSASKDINEKRAILAESMNKLDNEFMEKINKLIEDRLSSEKIDIGYLAENMNMSKSTLYRKMKALTGLSSNEYVRKIKMQYAERLLLEGRYHVSEVAFKMGINSVVYFRQCFKEEFGVSPSDYLRRLNSQKTE